MQGGLEQSQPQTRPPPSPQQCTFQGVPSGAVCLASSQSGRRRRPPMGLGLAGVMGKVGLSGA